MAGNERFVGSVPFSGPIATRWESECVPKCRSERAERIIVSGSLTRGNPLTKLDLGRLPRLISRAGPHLAACCGLDDSIFCPWNWMSFSGDVNIIGRRTARDLSRGAEVGPIRLRCKAADEVRHGGAARSDPANLPDHLHFLVPRDGCGRLSGMARL